MKTKLGTQCILSTKENHHIMATNESEAQNKTMQLTNLKPKEQRHIDFGTSFLYLHMSHSNSS
jgi:hypothetical protein